VWLTTASWGRFRLLHKVGEDGEDGKVGNVEKAGFLDCEKLRSLNELLRVIWRQLGYFHQ